MQEIFEPGNNDTICAVSTASGRGGIAVVRVSGPCALETVGRIWKGKDLSQVESHTVHLGRLMDVDGILDEAVATVFRAPSSYTGDDVVELSVHGSVYIQRRLIELLTCGGDLCRPALPGEFTRRAHASGRIDLAQAEAVADVIASSSRGAHRLAMKQLKGSVSQRIRTLREKLVEMASLLELELDFSEEDVEFASREALRELCCEIVALLEKLSQSFYTGKAVQEGLPVVIAGIPNAGKSTLLNELLDDDRAIVSDIPGTTRDFIEDTVEIDGVLFRFTDTAGLRKETADAVEITGIERARNKISNAAILLFLIDPTVDLDSQKAILKEIIVSLEGKAIVIPVINKTDCVDRQRLDDIEKRLTMLMAESGIRIKTQLLHSSVQPSTLLSLKNSLKAVAQEWLEEGGDDDVVLINRRHYLAINEALEELKNVEGGLKKNLPVDLVAQHLRDAISSLSSITGDIATPEILTTIFSRFCIGK